MKRLMINILVAVFTAAFLIGLTLYGVSFIYYPARILGGEFDFIRPVVNLYQGWLICYYDPPFGDDPIITYYSLWILLVILILPLLAVIAWDRQHPPQAMDSASSSAKPSRRSGWRSLRSRLLVITSLMALILALTSAVFWCDSYLVRGDRPILRKTDSVGNQSSIKINSIEGQFNIFTRYRRPLHPDEKMKLSTGTFSSFDGTTLLSADQYGFGSQGWQLRYLHLIYVRDKEAYVDNILLFPYYLMVLILLAISVAYPAWCWRARRKAERLAAQLCPQCGYDLRASPDRCPECGRQRNAP